MKKIFLVDTENVNLKALTHANNLDEKDTIILFVTQMTNSHQFEDKKINGLNIKANILKIHVITGRKNSLDLQLGSYLGLLIGEHRNEDNMYYIVSKDRDFIDVINLLENYTRYKIALVPSIIDINKCNFIERVKEAGFKVKTARKVYSIVQNSKTFEDMEKQIYITFNRNKSVTETLINIIKCYLCQEVA